MHETTSEWLVKNLDKVPIFRLDPSPSAQSKETTQGGYNEILDESLKTFFPHKGKRFLLNLLCDWNRGVPDQFHPVVIGETGSADTYASVCILL